MEADVQLPASKQQQNAGVVRYGGPEDLPDFRATQQLHSSTLHVRACVTETQQYRGRKTAEEIAAMRAWQQQQAKPKLEKQLYATLAGLLKWQLPWQLRGKEQRQLLTLRAFADLQVETADEGDPVPANTVGSRDLEVRLNITK
jgi:hypothetical protein